MKLESFFEINFSAFFFLFYSFISCLRCWWFLWDLSKHINPITSRWFPPLVHILWTLFALLAVFLSIRERRSLRSAHAIQSLSLFFSTPFMRSEIEREIKSVRRNPSRSVQLSQNILEKSLSGTREFWRINKSGKCWIARLAGCSRFGSNLSLLCYVIYHSSLPFGRSSWVEISTISYN